MNRPMQAVVVTGQVQRTGQDLVQLSLFDSAGAAWVLPKQAAAQTDVPALTQAAITGGESPTEAEFNALRTDHAATRTVLNSLLAKLRTSGVLAP